MQIPYEVSARPDTGLYNAKVGIWRCVEFYNAERPPSNLGKRTPDEALAALPRAVASTSAAMIEGERHVA